MIEQPSCRLTVTGRLTYNYNRGKNMSYTQEEFIEKAKQVHGNKYDYSKVVYIKSKIKVEIICPVHGSFSQPPAMHLTGQGCPICSTDSRINKLKLTTEEFIVQAKLVHGDRYDYSKTVYESMKFKVEIICKEHGSFFQLAKDHKNGAGCQICAAKLRVLSTRSNTEDFINKAKEIHNDKYDYSKVEYINRQTKVTITCPEHGNFEQQPNAHLSGQGCPLCGGRVQLTTKKFIENAKRVHGDRYDYSQTNYIKAIEPVAIICREHGIFYQQPNNHTSGAGCPKCITRFMDTDEFIKRARAIHGDKYEYDKVKFVNSKDKVTITCRKHGDFIQIASDHIRGYNCPKCNYSKGEETISKILTKYNIEYIPQYKIPEVEYRYRYDFYLPKYRLLIEFHGEQHYRPIDWFGGEEGFKDLQFRDKVKKTLAKLASYKFLEIKYTYLNKLSEEEFENKLMSAIVNK